MAKISRFGIRALYFYHKVVGGEKDTYVTYICQLLLISGWEDWFLKNRRKRHIIPKTFPKLFTLSCLSVFLVVVVVCQLFDIFLSKFAEPGLVLILEFQIKIRISVFYLWNIFLPNLIENCVLDVCTELGYG